MNAFTQQAIQVPPQDSTKTFITRGELAAVLTSLAGVIKPVKNSPIFSHIQIDTTTGVIRLTATDSAQHFSTRLLPMQSGTPFRCTTNARRLLAALRWIPSRALVGLELVDDTLHLTADQFHARLPTLPADDHPSAPDLGKPADRFEIGADVLAGMLERARRAMSNEETRYYLNGVYLTRIVDALRIVATDGHRMVITETPAPAALDFAIKGVIIHRAAIAPLLHMLAQGEAYAWVETYQKHVRFLVGDWVLIASLIDGTFPDYTRVVPKNNKLGLTVPADRLRAVLARVGSVIVDRYNGMELAMRPGEVELRMGGNGTEYDLRETITADCTTTMSVGFNVRYLRDALRSLSGDAQFAFGEDAAGAAIITSSADPRTQIILMPMRL
jgi:DNA polymerase-3 subunit beta